MPRTTDRDAMQARILAAARNVFSAKGLSAATMAQIAQEAGLAKGTLYLHFANKEALVLALVAQSFDQFRQVADTFDPPTPEAFQAALIALILRPEAELDETRAFFDLLGPGLGTPEVAALIEQGMAHLATRLEASMTALGFDPAPQQGRAMAAMIDGMVLHFALFRPDAPTRAAMAKAAVQQSR